MISGDELRHGMRPDGPPSALDSDDAAGGDLLREAQLTDVRFDPLSSTMALVFDLRNALGHPEADVAVVALSGVREHSWLGSGSAHAYQAWYVVDSKWVRDDYWCQVSFALLPGQRLRAQARSVELVIGRSERFEMAPPDLGEDSPAEIRAGFPSVETQFVVGDWYRLEGRAAE